MVKIVDDDHGTRNRNRRIHIQVQIIPNLDDNIAVEILSRIPPKTLVRLSSVCKTWLSLFSNNYFIKTHLDHINTNVNKGRNQENETLIIHSTDCHLTSLIQFTNSSSPFNMNFPFPNLFPGVDLVGSINGLICLSCPPRAVEIAIWNPVTKQCKYLPRPIIEHLPGTSCDISIGFCFDPSTSDYIVVRTIWCESKLFLGRRLELFSLNRGSWREITCDLSFTLDSICNTIVKGEPYWCAIDKPCPSMFALRFDIGNKVFRRVPSLKLPKDRPEEFRLVNYKNLFAVLVDSTLSLSSLAREYLDLGSSQIQVTDRTITLLVLCVDGRWRAELRVGLSVGIGRAIGCSKSGRIVLQDQKEKSVLFVTENKKLKKINIVEETKKNFLISNYTASFVPINGSRRATKGESED